MSSPVAFPSAKQNTNVVNRGNRLRRQSHSYPPWGTMASEQPSQQLPPGSKTFSHSNQRSPVPPEYPSQQSHSRSRTFSQSNSKQQNTMPPVISSQRSPHPIPPRTYIYFYDKRDPHYGFTNFSPHPVFYDGAMYPTSEHLFQSFKFREHRPDLADHIRRCSERPSVAFSEAHRLQPEVRSDWKEVNISKMDETLLLKFTQHPALKAELLATGDTVLVEDSPKDFFWGVGPDRRGRNELGQALMRLRSKLR